jgi:hypothetical protein
MKPTLEQKRKAVYEWHMNQDKQYLCSKILALFYKADLEQEYRDLPKEYKVKSK